MKRGQLEINETLLVLFIIVIIIVIGVFVYFRFSLANVEKIAGELSEQESTVLLASVKMLNEIQSSHKDCVDTSKLIPFKTLLQQERDYYNSILGYKKIVFEQLYPVVGEGECDVGMYSQEEYPNNCTSWIDYDRRPSKVGKRIVMSTIVSLYFPEIEENRIGKLEVTSYV